MKAIRKTAIITIAVMVIRITIGITILGSGRFFLLMCSERSCCGIDVPVLTDHDIADKPETPTTQLMFKAVRLKSLILLCKRTGQPSSKERSRQSHHKSPLRTCIYIYMYIYMYTAT